MKILLINHYAGSPEMGMEFRPYYMAQEWIKQGHKVYILAATHSHIRANNPKTSLDFEEQDLKGVKYLWIKTPSYEGNGLRRVKNIIHFLRKVNKFKSRIQSVIKPDLVIASSTYPADNYVARRIAKKSNALHFYEVHDLWPLSPIELGGMSKLHPFIIWMQMAENYAYRSADAVISMLPNTIEHMMSHGLEKEKWNYVPNGFVRKDWDNPIALNEQTLSQISEIRKKHKNIIGYTGTLGLANALDTYIDAAKLSKEDIAFVMVGTGPEKDRLQARITKEELHHVFILDSVSKTEVPSLLNEFDILFIGLQSQKLFRFGISPNKLIDYMMAEKPIIKAIDSGNDPVSDSKCGISIPPEQPSAIQNAIVSLLALSESERIEMGKRGRVYAEQNHNYENLTKKFTAIAENLR